MGWLNDFIYRSRRRAATVETDTAGNWWIFPDGGLPADPFGGCWRGNLGTALHVPEVFFPIDAVAERASSVPFRLMREDGMPVEAGREPAGFAALFARPNLQQDFGQLVYDLLFVRLATGTTWIWSDRTHASLQGTQAVRVLDPEAVAVRYCPGMPGRWMEARSYDEIAAGFVLPSGEVLDPADVTVSVERPDTAAGGLRGRSVLDTARATVEILRSVYRARYNVYNANGVAGILCKEGDKDGFGAGVDPRLRKEMADELSMQYNIAGFSRSVKAISTVPLKFIDTLARIKDLEPFKESDRDALAIAALYQVPKHLVPNEVGVTYDNAKESEVAFWDNVVLPAAALAGDLIGRAMSLPEGYRLVPDKTGVSALQEDRLGSLQADRQEIENLQTIAAAFPALADRAGALAEAMITRYEQTGND